MQRNHKAQLSEDEREALVEAASSTEFLTGVTKEMEEALRGFEYAVLSYSLQGGDERELVRLKCRAEGAANFLVAVRKRLEAHRARDK